MKRPLSESTANNSRIYRRRRLPSRWLLIIAVLFGLQERFVAVQGSDDNYYNTDDGDDKAYAGGDDAAATWSNSSNYRDDDYYKRNLNDDAYHKEQQQYSTHDDDVFHWDENAGFEGVSVMPVSCVS